MDVFALRKNLVDDYQEYTQSFITIQDTRVKGFVDKAMADGLFWPQPLLQLNPSFQPGEWIDGLADNGTLHPECRRIFRLKKDEKNPSGFPLRLHYHQQQAIEMARNNQSFVLTSGTGSGKSLTYIVPIVDHVLRRGSGKGIQAIVVYPMNALANSQFDELGKFLEKGYPEGHPPVSFARFTGQEKEPEREMIRQNPPDILLTNYMMLELLLTRVEDRQLIRAAQGLRFLVFDELHTYRGRQGADVSLLIRRARLALHAQNPVCIGTSATMSAGGPAQDQGLQVAQVAQTLFGLPFTADQVIGETLRRVTPELHEDDPNIVAQLRESIHTQQPPPGDSETFVLHPLSCWIESTFGIRTEPSTGQLVRQLPRPIEGENGAAAQLASLTGCSVENCARSLRAYLLKGSTLVADEKSSFPIFAFRLHQFFSRGDTVWATMEPEDQRHLEIAKKATQPGDTSKPLFPLVFCRHCGTAYYRVKILSDVEGLFLEPQDDARPDAEGSEMGYLYVSADSPWPLPEEPGFFPRLPPFLKEKIEGEKGRMGSKVQQDLPQTVYVDPTGRIVQQGQGMRAALIRGNFLFCLDPGCKVAHAKSQRSEHSKLGTLGVDNRSTATTILALRSLVELQADAALPPSARKLLSFTDNRQDASLQAGHFNDFAQVALLRSALYRACCGAGEEGITHDQLSGKVMDTMDLAFAEYAVDPRVKGPAKKQTRQALQRVVEYYLYRDLERGWRVTAPNLEDCDLLRFAYEGLEGADGLLEDQETWNNGFHVQENRKGERWLDVPQPLKDAPVETRKEILETLLEVLRRSLCVNAQVLDHEKQYEMVAVSNQRIREGSLWFLQDASELVESKVAWPRARKKNDHPNGFFVSSRGGFGQYLKRTLLPFSGDATISSEQGDTIIAFLFQALKRYGILQQVRGSEKDDDPGFQVYAGALTWLQGKGQLRPVDRTRLLEVGEIPPKINEYFSQVYRTFVDLNNTLEAREHTAQVSPEDRGEREERFRSGELPLLFCSPTMELGVDIEQLNLVNLRNVPPTPANYAQRSGRAGRVGQPALVYTYCAGRSPHDQYFFHEPDQMVSGVVAPPRIDLRNRDLLRAHIYAIWLETAQLKLGMTPADILDLNPQDGKLPLPVQDSLGHALRDPQLRLRATERVEAFIDTLRAELQSAPWFSDRWPADMLDQVERAFNAACDRWRSLYRSAVQQQKIHNQIIMDPSRPPDEIRYSKQLRAQAESQRDLLVSSRGVYDGDFYTYRYLAAEGFLPGYNFPRLPLSAFVPGRKNRNGRDTYISRPRFLAISEFGPRSLVYHEGAQYRVVKVNLDLQGDAMEATHELVTKTMKRCTRCGYAHFQEGMSFPEVCERCDAPLEGDAKIDHMVQLQNVTLKMARRITCDEEERQRFGYNLSTAYRFPRVSGKLDRRDATVFLGEEASVHLHYADSTDLFRINSGWLNQRDEVPGFTLDVEKGYWAKNQKDDLDSEDAAKDGRTQRVIPFVKDTRNALVITFEQQMSIPQMASLRSALKQAIQQLFQLEPRELACEPMPSASDPREILFYEASEGGAGVLRQVVEDAGTWAKLARQALRICHFDPDTLEDRGKDSCGKACYRCLMDYFNQPDHKHLDRFLVRDMLKEWTGGVTRQSGGQGSRSERLAQLHKQCDSELESKWLRQLESLGLQLPTHAQHAIPGAQARPDFYYDEHHVAIFVDGPAHRFSDQQHKDAQTTDRLMDLGYIVVRFPHDTDWNQIFQKYPDIFGRCSS